MHGIGAWVVGAWGFGFGVSINDVSYYLDGGVVGHISLGKYIFFFHTSLVHKLEQ